MVIRVVPIVILALSAGLAALGPAPEADPQVGQSFRVPYRLTDTNHYLVRVRLNGKGPFNFLVDSGAPALYVGTEAAKAAGIDPAEDDYWTRLESLELEGGVVLHGMNARIEDPFQLVGMNALGLPGASIDGILGFTVLARFRLEFDPTDDRMTWTRLDHEPGEPFLPRSMRTKAGPAAPAEVRAMQAMGPLMKFAAAFVGKQPPEKREPQGFLGLVLGTTAADGSADGVPITAVLAGSPAAQAGLAAGDRLVRLEGHDVRRLAEAHEALAEVRPGAEVVVVVTRNGPRIEARLTAAGGF
jgi:hypothetical protein